MLAVSVHPDSDGELAAYLTDFQFLLAAFQIKHVIVCLTMFDLILPKQRKARYDAVCTLSLFIIPTISIPIPFISWPERSDS